MFDSEAYLRPTDVSGGFLHRFLLTGEGELLGLARIIQSRAIVDNDGERTSMDFCGRTAGKGALQLKRCRSCSRH